MNRKGFTLVEILVVTLILGVTAGLAIPGYANMMEVARSNEAKASLGIVLMAQKVYKLNSPTAVYYNPGSVSYSTINTNLNIDLMPQYYGKVDNWTITANGGTSFTATAPRDGAATKIFTIDETGSIGESGSY